MALERVFTLMQADFDTMIVQGMDDVVQSGLVEMRGQFFTAMCLYILGLAILVMWHKMDIGELCSAAIRALVVSTLLAGTNYNYYVRSLFFTDLPNRWAAAMGGPSMATGSAEQFDALWSAVMRCVATVATAAPGFLGTFDRTLAYFFAFLIMLALLVMFVVWLMSRVFMALVICMGPFLLLTFLFKSTRFIGEAWIGKLVGIAALQLTSSILLRFVLKAVSARMYGMQNQMGASVDMMHATMLQITAVFWIGAMLMLIAPTVVAIGSGMGAGAAAASLQLGGMAARFGRMPLQVVRFARG